jgi:CheY-like chemotaxis protein
MPLILAIENNRPQITELTSIVRGLGAELVFAESAAHALKALGSRVPDLILIPPLLSPQDDTALTNRLRELGTAAAHVQTLSIPILVTSGAKSRGKLSRLRKPKEGPMGCAPDVFAGQLAEYLERAAGERERTAASTRRSEVATGAVREATAAEHCSSEEVAEPVAEAARASVDALAAEERTAKAAAEAKAAEERLATVEAALAVAEARAMDEQRAAGEAARIATEARIVEEQRAAKAAADATAAEERRAAAEAEATAAAARAADQQQAAAQAAQAATEARVAEEQRAARATAEAKAAEERRAKSAAKALAAERRRVAAETARAAAEAARAVEETKAVDERPSAVRDEPSDDGTPHAPPESQPAVTRKNRKTKRRRGEQTTDEASFFDPREVRFATLVAQLDEITGSARPRRRSGRTVN